MRKPVYAICEQQNADQPAHQRSLISAFVVRCLDSIIPLVSISKISSLYLASLAVQDGLCLTWSQTPKTFSRDEAHIILCHSVVAVPIELSLWLLSVPKLSGSV